MSSLLPVLQYIPYLQEALVVHFITFQYFILKGSHFDVRVASQIVGMRKTKSYRGTDCMTPGFFFSPLSAVLSLSMFPHRASDRGSICVEAIVTRTRLCVVGGWVGVRGSVAG